MSESRYDSSESRKPSYYNNTSSESRNSESRIDTSKKSQKSNGFVDAIDTLIDMYRAGKIDGDDLANSLKKLNS